MKTVPGREMNELRRAKTDGQAGRRAGGQAGSRRVTEDKEIKTKKKKKNNHKTNKSVRKLK